LPDCDTIERGARRIAVGGDDDRQRAKGRHNCGQLDRGNRRIGAQQCDIRRMVAAGDRGGRGAAVGEADLDVALVGQRLVGGDDQAGFPDEAGGAGTMRMDGDDGRRGAGHHIRERGRQRSQGS
jgi:hypothetical protein